MRRGSVDIQLSSEIVTVLADMAERNGTSIPTEIKRAIEGRKFFTEKIAEGYDIFVEDPKKNTAVQVILTR